MVELHKSAAKGFQVIMSGDYDSLSKKSFCNERLLYRQKFFAESIANLQKNNTNHLTAFGYLLQDAPAQFFELHCNKVSFGFPTLCFMKLSIAFVDCTPTSNIS